MAKDKAAKERQRAKRKAQQKQRDKLRRSAVNNHFSKIVAGLEEGSIPGLAAMYSVREGPRPHPTPSYFDDFKASMDKSGATDAISYWIRYVTASIEDAHGQLWPLGFALLIDTATNQHVRPISLPGQLFFASPQPTAWMNYALKNAKENLIAWLVWDHDTRGNEFAVVLAMDRESRLAVWFLDEDHLWHAATAPEQYLEVLTTEHIGLPDEAGIDELVALAGASSAEDKFPMAADDPTIVAIVQAVRVAQQPIIQAFFDLVAANNESDEILDFVVDEADRSIEIKKTVDALRRRTEALERERDDARHALDRERKSRQQLAAVTTKTVPLTQRLAAVFA